ncbi:hypothetical protein ACB092_09G191600 [Castanea dentata]
MESPSNMISRTPISLAKSRPVSKAFASASNAPNGTSSFLLRAASTLPSLSLMITPTPADFWSVKSAPSTLTLDLFPGGGSHELLNTSIGVGGPGDSVAVVYSARYVANK